MAITTTTLLPTEEGTPLLPTTTEGSVVVVDWLELPKHLTSLITSKLTSLTDFVRFGGVCVEWHSIFLNDEETTKSLLHHPQLPLLMIPTPPLLLSQEKKEKTKNKKTRNKRKKKKKKNNNNNKSTGSTGNTISCSFYRVTDGKIFNGLRLAMPHDRYVRGSVHGWLITVDQNKQKGYSVKLINPFFYPNSSTPTTKEIKLPPLTAHPYNKLEPVTHYMHLRKAVLSADPVSNPMDFMVMAIFGKFSSLSFCKSGDKAWTPIRDNVMKGCFDDLIYYKGKFYAVHCDGTIVICNVANCMAETFAGPPVTEFESYKKYLVILSGELLQVHRNVEDEEGGITVGFKVFKLQEQRPNTDWVEVIDLQEQRPNTDWVELKDLLNTDWVELKDLQEQRPNYTDWVEVKDLQEPRPNTIWVEVKDLYGHVLFLGDNASISISASDFPGCKPNSIYYTDDNIEHYWSNDSGNGPHDLGVFNLENGSFEKHYPTSGNVQIWPAPIWIEPTLQRSTTRAHHAAELDRM